MLITGMNGGLNGGLEYAINWKGGQPTRVSFECSHHCFKPAIPNLCARVRTLQVGPKQQAGTALED